MAFHIAFRRVPLFPCLVRRSLAASSCKHPQLLVLPFRNFAPSAIDSLPQSQRQYHVAQPKLVEPSRQITTSLPNRCPVKSFTALIYHLHPFLQHAIMLLDKFSFAVLGGSSSRGGLLFALALPLGRNGLQLPLQFLDLGITVHTGDHVLFPFIHVFHSFPC